jgi:lipopolysaccharide transport system ATP-binding protein
MTGRENIFLNGAILGMTKKEIASKLDEIIEFSGCERYIDTPVKRYSSGMYVRLAFAVAAFLEPEILIVDEVLAVGDAEFQKKAIGKMQDISKGEGRTVLFVSHNMDAVLRICSRSILMNNGKIINEGFTSDIVEQYLKEQFNLENSKEWESCISSCGKLKLLKVFVHDELLNNKSDFKLTEKLGVTVFYEVLDDFGKLQVALNFFNSSGVNVFDSHETKTELYNIRKGDL